MCGQPEIFSSSFFRCLIVQLHCLLFSMTECDHLIRGRNSRRLPPRTRARRDTYIRLWSPSRTTCRLCLSNWVWSSLVLLCWLGFAAPGGFCRFPSILF